MYRSTATARLPAEVDGVAATVGAGGVVAGHAAASLTVWIRSTGLEGSHLARLCRWELRLSLINGLYPISHLLRQDLRAVLNQIIPDDGEYERANDRYEYRIGLLQIASTTPTTSTLNRPGESGDSVR
jgi:hypothetical protein